MRPTIEHVVELFESHNFVGILEVIALLALSGLISYAVFKWKKGKYFREQTSSRIHSNSMIFIDTVNSPKNHNARRTALITLGICLGVDFIVLGIVYRETGE